MHLLDGETSGGDDLLGGDATGIGVGDFLGGDATRVGFGDLPGGGVTWVGFGDLPGEDTLGLKLVICHVVMTLALETFEVVRLLSLVIS